MVIDYFYDDYKRSEGYSNVIGIVDSKIEAYKKVLSLEYEENKWCKDKDEKYKKLYEKIGSINEKNVDKFYEEWKECRDDALGYPEFTGLLSTGHRAYVKECELINSS